MRWLRGGSLSASLARKSLSIETVAQLLDQIGSALAAAHQRGVVHRDLKPANILLDDDSNFFLTDFGIAKDLHQATSLSQSDPLNVVGSPAYMAPEQIKTDLITPQTDIYSLGILLYELLTGELPFSATTPIEMMFKHLNEPLPPLQERRPDLPSDLGVILQRATAKNPAERYRDVLSLVDDYRRAVMPTLATTRGSATSKPASSLSVGTVSSTPSAIRPRDTLVLDMGPPMANPYKGLRAFQEADGPDFFGREALGPASASTLGRVG
jgi:serine/threonine protein kinase